MLIACVAWNWSFRIGRDAGQVDELAVRILVYGLSGIYSAMV